MIRRLTLDEIPSQGVASLKTKKSGLLLDRRSRARSLRWGWSNGLVDCESRGGHFKKK